MELNPEELIPRLVIYMVVLLLAISAHEAAHAWMSYKFGDDTARLLGRITLNPLAHTDPIGTLLIPIVGFLPADDPRVKGTLRAIEEKLLIGDGEFVLRYESEQTQDGLPPGEGAFLACSFWLIDNYILQGRREDACKLFDRLLARCNDVGLLAEEFEPVSGRMLGNFPQAYSHVGLINAALNLARISGPLEERAEPAPEVVEQA